MEAEKLKMRFKSEADFIEKFDEMLETLKANVPGVGFAFTKESVFEEDIYGSNFVSIFIPYDTSLLDSVVLILMEYSTISAWDVWMFIE